MNIDKKQLDLVGELILKITKPSEYEELQKTKQENEERRAFIDNLLKERAERREKEEEEKEQDASPSIVDTLDFLNKKLSIKKSLILKSSKTL